MSNLVNVKDKADRGQQAYKNHLSIFRAYDVRGIYPQLLDSSTAYKIIKAYLQIVPGKRYALAYDMRRSSPYLRDAVIQAIIEENLEVDCLGATTTDHLYYTVGVGGYDGGIMITASHNAANFNGLKLMKKEASPVSVEELKDTYVRIEQELHYLPLAEVEPSSWVENKKLFLDHVQTFSEGLEMRPMKIVIDAGNGMAGELTEMLFARHKNIEIIKMFFEPHPDFPHHEANPAVQSNLIALKEKVRSEKAELGVAFDGDGDRVFFVDENGDDISGYYIQALLSEYFLNVNKGAAIVYDLRNTRAIESVVRVTGGRAVVSKAGHTFVKQKMRQEDAIFGGESTSSHFYFRENYYADSGLITLEVILKLLTVTKKSLSQLTETYRNRFFASGEKNFYTKKPEDFSKLVERLKNEFPQGTFSEFDGFIIDFSDWRFSIRESGTEPFWRLNLEAINRELLSEKLAVVFNIIEEFAKYTGHVSNLYALETLNLSKKDKLEYLFSNLHFTWNPYRGEYLDSLYGTEWTRNQTPLDILRLIDSPVLDEFYEKNKYNIEESVRLLKTYLNIPTWFDQIASKDKIISRLSTNPIAYFSLEFGLTDWLQIYSGGLGILAGDTLKEASDSGIPMVGIGLFYANGYFYQRFTEDGWQLEDYLPQDIDDYPLESVKDENGYTIIVDVKIGEKIVKVKGWQLKVGRRSLILLDTNFSDNKDMEDRMITYHLYGGDEDTRIKQELVLAMGGYKLLRASGIKPSILHLNEGHSAFALLAQAEEIMHTKGVGFDQAIVESRRNILFTNHTLKQAGNDVFPYSLVEKYLGVYAQSMSVNFRDIFALGVDPIYAEGKFGMTILGLNNAAKTNAVSELHAVAAKKIWPDHDLIPVTNGVHMPTWVSEPINHLLDEYVGERWNEQGANINWDLIDKIPDEKLWEANEKSKRRLISQIKENYNIEVPQNSLILGWFRRVTSYKQPEILTLDLEQLKQVVSDSDRPVTFIFGGKAHPKDTEGKEILKKLYQITQQDDFRGKLILIPDYNWRMARYLYAGCDVWINSPIRYQEACGTSGMKAAANGALQFSTIDGWVDEIKDSGIVWEIEDNLNSNQYYQVLREQIIPCYWERTSGIPTEWTKRMKTTIKIALRSYSTSRMLRDYVEKLYRPLLKDNHLE